jgi:hypothetical protein
LCSRGLKYLGGILGLVEGKRNGAYTLTTPSGEEHHFAGIVDVARWATANAFG